MSHLEIDICLDGGFMERLYVKPEKGEALKMDDIFPEYLDIKKWYIHEAR